MNETGGPIQKTRREEKKLYGGVETGGTKINCLIATGPKDIRAETRFSTTTPQENIRQIVGFFQAHLKDAPIVALGIASFGPLDLTVDSPTYGYVTVSNKPSWEFSNIAGKVQHALQVPVAIDTDVNGAALAEYAWGAARNLENVLYITVGTGIGVGVVIAGKPLHGLIHPEGGHMLIPHDWSADPFIGVCPFHGDCLEGLACGPAIKRRWGQPAEALDAEHPAWYLEANYLGLGLHNLIMSLSPNRIVLGGGVMNQKHLFPLIRRKVQQSLSGYLHAEAIAQKIDEYIVPARLAPRSGMLGAIALAASIGRLG
jgi:fructokinase